MKKKKNKDNANALEKKRDLASISLIIFLFDKLSELIYNALKNGIFGKIFTSYSKVQENFDESFVKKHFADNARIKRYIRTVRKYFSKAFETSFFLNTIENISKSIVSFPLKSVGTFGFSFGVYVVIMYLIRLFLPIVSQADVSFVIVGVVSCITSVPMLLSRDNIAGAVGKSVILGGFFSNALGFRDESFKQRTEMSRFKINLFIICGMLLGILSFVIHPIWIIISIFIMICIALIIVSPEIGIIFALFTLPFLSFFQSPAITMGLIVLTIIMSYFIKLIRGKRILKFEIIDLAVLLFVGIIFFSGTITSGGTMGYHEALITCELAVGYFLVVNLIRTEKWVHRCVFSIVSAGTIVAWVGIFQYIIGAMPTGAWLDTDYFYDIEGRATSLFDNPNILGMYLILVLPFALLTLIRSSSGKAKLLSSISIASILICTLLTWSRAAWISALVCVLLFFLIYSKKTLRYIFASLFVIPFVPFFLPDSVTKRFLSIGNLADSSTMYRLYTWRGTVAAIKDYFISGVGYGLTAFQEIYPEYAYAGIEAAEHSHNLYLQIILGTGITGLIAFAIVIFLFLQMNFEYINSSDGKFTFIVAACICAVISLLVFGMFDYVWYNYRIFFLFWAVIALSCACVRIGRDDQRRHGYTAEADVL